MKEIFVTRQNWILKLDQLKEPYDYVSIHPCDDLTVQMVIDAMRVQGMDAAAAGRSWEPRTSAYNVSQHGNRISIQLLKVDEIVECDKKGCKGFLTRLGPFCGHSKCPHKDYMI